jgi:hypothetical protein
MFRMKKVILVIGVSPRDVFETVYHLKESTFENENVKVVDESQIIEQFVEANHLHRNCIHSWKKPIEDKILVSILETIDIAFENGAEVVIVTGNFLLDRETRLKFEGVLKSENYDVDLHLTETTWFNILREYLDKDLKLTDAVRGWEQYNHQFSRQYKPLQPDQQRAVLVALDSLIVNPEPGSEEVLQMVLALSNSGYKVIGFLDNKSKDTEVRDRLAELGIAAPAVYAKDEQDHQSIDWSFKSNIFWRHVANHYDVRLIIEDNPNTTLEWRKIGLPIISLSNPFNLKENF